MPHAPFSSAIIGSKVVVDGVDRADAAASEADEEWVGGQRLEVERAPRARHGGVDEHADLLGHAVANHGPDLHRAEAPAELRIDPLASQKLPEGDEPGDGGQRGVIGGEVDRVGVGTTEDVESTPPISTLAIEGVSTHLLGARRGVTVVHRKAASCSRRAYFARGSRVLIGLASAAQPLAKAKSMIKRTLLLDSPAVLEGLLTWGLTR
jgi:hypothetical protein